MDRRTYKTNEKFIVTYEILNDNQIFDGGFSNLEKFKNLLSNQNFDNLTNEQLNVINNFRTFISGQV